MAARSGLPSTAPSTRKAGIKPDAPTAALRSRSRRACARRASASSTSPISAIPTATSSARCIGRREPKRRSLGRPLPSRPRGRGCRDVVATGERLSCWSSVLWVPWAFVAKDCVEDGEQFARCCDERDELRFSGGDEAVAEQLEIGIVTCGDHGAEEQRRAHAGTSAANEALASPLAGLAGPRRKSDERGNLAPIERAELGQFGQERACDDFADTRNGREQVFLFTPSGGTAHRIIDRGFECRELLLERRKQTRDALLQSLLGQSLLPLAFGYDHADDLTAPGDKLAEQARRFVRQRPNGRLGR